jgi:hypothetical protein
VDGFFMSFFSQLCRDRGVRLAALCAVVALLAGLWLLPFRLAAGLAAGGGPLPAQDIDGVVNAAAITAAVKSGYWVMLAVLVLFARAAWRVGRDAWRARRPGRAELAAFALALAGGGVLLAHEHYGFKVVEDEVLLLGTSMGMHLDREAAYPARAHDIQGPFQLVQSVLDKRPFFFPFLVALVHDLTGYRAANPFYVNTALGFALLALVWLLGRGVGGSPWAGAALVLLFAGLPLLGQQMAGGGFDLLNLVMLAAVALLAREFATRRDAPAQEALVLGAVLLAYTRYESVIFLAPVAALLLWAWWRDGRVTLTWPVVVAPLLLLPWLWQHRVFAVNPDAWELASRPGATAPFATEFLADNLGYTLRFFFDADRDQFFNGYQPSSPLFSALGLLALPFFGLGILRALRAPRAAAPADVALAAVGAGLFAGAGLLMLYYRHLDEPVIHRLSLPLHLLFALAIVAAGVQLRLAARGWQTLSALALVALMTHSLPVMAKQAYELEYTPGIEMAWRQEFLKKFPEHDYLFIDRDSYFWIVNEISATPPLQAKLRRDNLLWLMRNRGFTEMYVFQQFHVVPADDLHPDTAKTAELRLEPEDDLGPDFELEPVWERRIATLVLDRISRVTAIHANGQTAVQTHLATPAAGPARTSAELEKAQDAYINRWLQELP